METQVFEYALAAGPSRSQAATCTNFARVYLSLVRTCTCTLLYRVPLASASHYSAVKLYAVRRGDRAESEEHVGEEEERHKERRCSQLASDGQHCKHRGGDEVTAHSPR